MASDPASEPRLSRDAWLRRALEVLRDEGVQGVRIERLARDLGVTKGSFYWHFKDRGDLRRSMLDYWTEKYNDVIVQHPEYQDAEPAAGLLAAVRRVRAEGLDHYELAMRAWAAHDEEAAAAVRAAYEKRTTFVRGFFTRLGFRGLAAEIRTRLALCYLSWEPSMYPDEPESRRLQLLDLQHELLTGKR